MGKSGFGKQEYEKYLSHLHYEIRINGEVINPAIDSKSLVDPQKLISPIDGGILPQIEVTAKRIKKERVKFVDLIKNLF